MNPVGQTIRTLRSDKKWSQETMARQLFISVPAYSKIESGITDVNLSRLEQIASVFDLPVTDLFKDAMVHSAAKDLLALDTELIYLQQSVIGLYEQLRDMDTSLIK